MGAYRVYYIDRSNHISRPPEVIECADDEEAIKQSRQFIDGKDIELWEGRRLIVRFPRHADK